MKSSFSNSLLDSTKYLENITQVRNDLYHNFKIRTDELETLQAIKNLKQLPVSKNIGNIIIKKLNTCNQILIKSQQV